MGLTDDEIRTVGWFRRVAFWESVSYVVLIAASIAKRLDGPNLVPTLGPIHGIGFVVYLVLALQVRPILGWTAWRTLAVLGASVIPIAGFFVAKELESPQKDDSRI